MVKRVQCPGCAQKGEDNSGNNLALFEDDPSCGWCFKCAKNYSTGEKVTYKKKDDDFSVEAVKSYPIKEHPELPVSKEILERYQIRCSVNESTGKVDRVYYPYYDQDTIVGYKVRKFPKDFTAVGKIKGLFGQKQCKENARLLIIVEGEKDHLAVAEILKKKGKDYNVVSLPNGANEQGTIDSVVRKELEWIVKHENVIVCLDSDKPGQETAKALAELLVSQTTVRLMALPRKDSADMLIHGEVEIFWKNLSNTKPYRPEAIIDGRDVDFDEIMKPDPPGVDLPYPKLNNMLKGLRKGEITLVVAGSGIGKSSFCREISYDLVKHKGMTIANIFLETQFKDVAKAYIALDNNIPLWKLKFNEDALPRAAAKKSFDELIGSGKVHFFKHFGSIASEDLLSKCHYYAKVLNCDFIVLDHISMVVSGLETDNERKDIDQLMTNLAKFVVETGVGVLAVVHLKRVSGKSFNSGDEVELTDLRGSASLEQLSWTVIAAERDMQDETRKNLTRIRLIKNRTLGFTGLADTLMYHSETGRMAAIDMEY